MYLRQISLSALYKVANILLNFYLVSLIVSAIGIEGYGIYTAAISITTWMFLFDFGLAKGARNVITKALLDNDYDLIRRTVLLTYIVTISVICFMMLVIYFLDITFNIFQIKSLGNQTIILLLITCLLYFLFSIVDQLNYAIHKSNLVFFNSFLVVFCNVVFIKLSEGEVSVDYIVIVFCAAKIAPYLLSNIQFFINNKNFRFGFSTPFDKLLLKAILSKSLLIISVQFFFLLLIGFDRVLLLNLSTAEEVANYDVLYRVMAIIMLPYSLLVSPIWATLKKVLEEKDWPRFCDIKAKFYYLLGLAMLSTIFIAYSFDWIVFIWLEESFTVAIETRLLMATLFFLFIYCGFYTDVYFSFDIYKVVIAALGLSVFVKCLFLFILKDYDAQKIILSSVLGYLVLGLYFLSCHHSVTKKRFKA